MDDFRPRSSRYLRDAVEAAVREGATLSEIESEIVDGAALSPDGRSALWLYAWGATERRRAGKPLMTVVTEPRFDVR
jgi:hypothetical protein